MYLDEDVIPCLSVRQWWASWIVEGWKPVENRVWAHKPRYRGPLLIHAGDRVEHEAIEALYEIDRPRFDELVIDRAIEPVSAAWDYASAKDIFRVGPRPRPSMATGSIVGIVDLVNVVEGHKSPWAVSGALHFVMANARPFVKPIPWKGQLGLFAVPVGAVERQIIEAERIAV